MDAIRKLAYVAPTAPDKGGAADASRPALPGKGRVLRSVIGDVGWSHQFERNVDLLVNRFALRQLHRRIQCAATLGRRVLEHGHVQFTRLHRGQGVLRRVDAADLHRRHVDARGLHRLDRADRHFVVVGDHAIERRTGRQPVGHQGLGLITRPVGGLLVDDVDLHLAAAVAHHIMDVLGPLHGGLVRQFALHDIDVDLSLPFGRPVVAELDGFQRAGFHFVRGDEGLVVGQGVDVDRLAVHIDQRDVRGSGGIRHRLRRRGIDRVHDDRVNARGDEVVDLVQLLGDVVLRILDLHLQAGRIGLRLDAVAQHGQEVVVEQRHRHADAVRHGGRAHQRGQARSKKRLFHVSLPWWMSGTSWIEPEDPFSLGLKPSLRPRAQRGFGG